MRGTAEAALARVLADCQARAPEEAVGVVLAAPGGGAEVVPLPNAASEPRRSFEVPARAWLALERRAEGGGQRVAALYHSHPGGPLALSARDLAFATPGGVPLLAGLQLWLVGPDRTGNLSQFKCFSFIEGRWLDANPCSFG